MPRIRLFSTGIILFFLVGAGAAWVLSNQGILQNSWAPPLGTAFSVLGVLVAFVQWTIPLPSFDPKPSAESAKSSQARGIYLKQIYDRLAQGYGALVIYEKKSNMGENVRVSRGNGNQSEEVQANIVERIVNDYPLVAAVFPHLRPDNYKVRGEDYSKNTDITVFPGQVAEVDWRRKASWDEEQEMKKRIKVQKSSKTSLRAKSAMIGLGGVLFLVHRYMILPYLDTIGICLIALGVVNLLSSFVLDWLGWLQDVDKYGDKTTSYRSWIFVIELGAVLFFVHRYAMIPYLDIAGIILMSLGVIGLAIVWLG